MFEKLVSYSLENKLVVIVAAVILLVIGVFFAMNLSVDVFPDLTAPTVTVLTEAHGMAPEEVEMMVTFPIESSVNGATGIRRVRSFSMQGFSTVWVEFDWGMDIYLARQIVNEKLASVLAELPQGVEKPVLAPITSLLGEIMIVALTADTTTAMELNTLARYSLGRRFLGIPGVAQVKVYGGEIRQYQVFLDPYKLQKYKVSLNRVLDAVAASNLNAAGGFYVQGGQEFLIRGIGRLQGIDELEKSVVTTIAGVPVVLQDIARVTIGPAVKVGDASFNRNPCVMLVISKQMDVNTIKLTKNIKSVLQEYSQSLPADVKIHTDIFNQADFIKVAIQNVFHALRDGAVLVVLILLVFLWSFRTTFISSTAIPLSLGITIVVLRIFGFSINTMTLGGMAIAIGVLIDDAIVYVDNVYRRLKSGIKIPFNDVISRASAEIRQPVVMGNFIVVIVFLPLFFLSGLEGRMLKPLGIAFLVSVVASLWVAFTVTPALCGYMLKHVPKSPSEDSILVRKLKSVYRPLLQWSLRRRRFVLSAALLLTLAAIGTLPFLGRTFLPDFNEGTLNVALATVPGTSIQESSRIGLLTEELLLDHPAVMSVARRTGRAEADDHALGSHAHEFEVKIDSQYKSRQQLLSELRILLSQIPGSAFTLSQPITHRIDHMLSGARASIAVKIFGPDLYTLRQLSKQVQDVMSQVPGVTDLNTDLQTDVPQVQIRPDRDKMALYGLTVADIDRLVDTAFLGTIASDVYEGQNRFDLLVRYDEKYRYDLEAIKKSLVDTPSGARIPLDMVADVQINFGPNYISRENVQRKTVLQANAAERDVRSVVNDIRRAVKSKVVLPKGYYIEYGGQFESEARATKTITLLSILSLLLLILALYMEFHQLQQVFLVLVNLPLALIGGVLALFFTDGIMSVASLIGFVTLFGVAVRNGILLVSHYNHLLKIEGKTIQEAVVLGSLDRLNPILMTALTTGLALLPLALGADKPGNEIQAPLSIVVLGGLMTSTFLNLIVLPVAFERWGVTKR
ncbi:efflux RND transporter permease subunit [candidate division KSB1 bacterium]|nr:efflux RND transporter permease subunit [candidate division KSB1 bacterium]